MDTKMLKDFDVYNRLLMETDDVDPMYPFIKKYLEYNKNIDKYWFLFIYVLFYDLGSAVRMMDYFPHPHMWNENKFVKLRHDHYWKIAHERRGMQRTIENQCIMIEHIRDLIDDIYFMIFEGERDDNFLMSNKAFRQRIEKMPYHGGWASFKIAELFEKVLDFDDLTIPDLGIDHISPNSNKGPVGGLRWIFGREHKFGSEWREIWNRFGSLLSDAYNVDIGKIETCFCKWHKMMMGKYYVGHDIHEICESKEEIGDDFEKIMSECFPAPLWKYTDKVMKEHKTAYRDEGKIVFDHLLTNKLNSVNIYDIIMEL